MSAIKIHAFIGSNNGTESCDFRGDKFIGHPEDEHRTLLEIDPASEEEIDIALSEGPMVNSIFSKLSFAFPDGIGLGLVGKVGLRLGVWDD